MIQLIDTQYVQMPGETDGEGLFIVDGRKYHLNEHGRLIPDQTVPSDHVGWMYDGVQVYINGRLYKAHTRAESSEEYEHLSQ